MALDGIFLYKTKNELSQKLIGLRIDKVQQPMQGEIVLTFRGRQANYRLLICVRADSPRVHLTTHTIANPAVPPMFCMLLRKHLTGAMLTDITQLGLDRVLFLHFSGTNEIGDKTRLTLCVEIMGKYSNLILTTDGRIIDCIKRVDATTSSVRQLLPNLDYVLPPAQGKLNLLCGETQDVLALVLADKTKQLSSALLSAIEGISPVVAREIAFRCGAEYAYVNELSENNLLQLRQEIDKIKSELNFFSPVYMLCENNEKPKELSFMKINQYGSLLNVKRFDSPSELLDEFYFERDRINRINHRGREMIRLITNLIERTSRKLSSQRAELDASEKKDELKLFGELIMANLNTLKKGSAFYLVENYYDNMSQVKIPCNPALTPKENANRYYRSYCKAKTAEVMLNKLIVDGENELAYLESVLDEISRADSDSELSAIRSELVEGGYVKEKGNKKCKTASSLPPIEYFSSDGYRILVGRNNVQNDRLSMKTANKNDMWLHIQGFPGSHVIIQNQNGEVSDLSIEQAAAIAAYYSKARETSQAAVDYTKVRHLKKPNGAKPGKVIYHEYYTIIVKPGLPQV